jgi:hypothetical protein
VTQLSAVALYTVKTATEIYRFGLEIAQVLGLPVTSWRVDDPTRALFKFLAEQLATREEITSEYIKAGWLSTAADAARESGSSDWIKIHAREVYGFEATEATPDTPTVTLKNTGSGYYSLDAGDLIVKASSIGKTYHSTSAGIITPSGSAQVDETEGPTVVFNLEADEAGSDSSVIDDEIDTLVTQFLGVTITDSTEGIGIDEQSPDDIEEQCNAALGALSPNGPPDAYEYVVRNPDLTGVTDITRAATVDDSDTGDVTVYVAGSSGAVAGASVTAAQDAVEAWSTPLCITPTVTNATAAAVAVTADVSGEDIPADFEDLIEDQLGVLLAGLDIGETVAVSAIIACIQNTLEDNGATNVIVDLSAPAANVELLANEVPTLGTVTIVEV